VQPDLRQSPRPLRQWKDAAIGASPTTGLLIRNARGLGIGAIAALFLSFSGAFGTDGAPFAQRLAYWAGLMIGGSAMGAVTISLIQRFEILETRPWLQGLLIVAIITGPINLMVYFASTVMFPSSSETVTFLTYLPQVLIITIAMTALNYATEQRQQTTSSTKGQTETVRFLNRFPAKLKGATLLAVEAEDHYLRLHTDKGSDLILMRLADAIGELEGIEGARTHRSWWVAKAGIVEAARGDGRATLTLKDGTKVPVSRSYAAGLREAGWF
jgi:DNA-binding LytR/AlgR family response regulator